MHLHIDDIVRMLPVWKAEAIVLVHVSRRTTIHYARERIEKLAGEHAGRIHLLMDHRTNRARYESQLAAAAGAAAASTADKAVAANDGVESQAENPAAAE
jgi:hypothetical protein